MRVHNSRKGFGDGKVMNFKEYRARIYLGRDDKTGCVENGEIIEEDKFRCLKFRPIEWSLLRSD